MAAMDGYLHNLNGGRRRREGKEKKKKEEKAKGHHNPKVGGRLGILTL